MTLKKLELQNIETLIIEKKKDDQNAIISILDDVAEVKFVRNIFTFKKFITELKEIDMNAITKLNKCLSLANGGISTVNSCLLLEEDKLFASIEVADDEITSVKTHDRIMSYMCQCICYIEVFTHHSI